MILNNNENAYIIQQTVKEYLETVPKIENDDNSNFLETFLKEFKSFQTIYTNQFLDMTDDEKLILIKKGMILIDQFHESLTGEVLWYHVGYISNNGKYIEKRLPWQNLFQDDYITLQNNNTTIHMKLNELSNSVKQSRSFQNYQNHWKLVMKWFYAYTGRADETYYLFPSHVIDYYMSNNGNFHPVYRHKEKDSNMYLYFSGIQRQINYTYLTSNGKFMPSFNAGHVKERFDEKYYGYKHGRNSGARWFNKLMNLEHPMGEILKDTKGDSDLGTLTGDIRQSKNKIIQDKFTNSQLYTIEQLVNSINKIQEQLKILVRSEYQDRKHLQQLLKLFQESDISEEMANTIEKSVIKNLKAKGIKIK